MRLPVVFVGPRRIGKERVDAVLDFFGTGFSSERAYPFAKFVRPHRQVFSKEV